MQGYIRNLNPEKLYGFITCPETQVDYFFHKDDFEGHWIDLKTDWLMRQPNSQIHLEFEITDKGKGPRAKNVRRIQWPDEG